MVRERGQGAEGEPTQLCHMTTLLRQHFPDLAQSYHIKALGIFGSYVRNEQTLESDLDILIDFEDITQQSLLTVARLENILSDVLGVKVDLTLYQSLKPTIGKAILKEVVWL
jgi:predicted nucleotidyltransferase